MQDMGIHLNRAENFEKYKIYFFNFPLLKIFKNSRE